MKRRSVFSVGFLVAVAVFCVSGLAAVAGERPIILKMTCTNSTTHPIVRALNEKFIPEVERLSNGRIEVQLFDNAQLGGERDTLEQLQAGMTQMMTISPVLGSIEPAMNVLDLPFLFKDEAHVDAVVEGPVGMEILKDLPSKGIVHLGWVENGFRVITNSIRPINSLADLKGLKIRTPEAPISVAIFNALGANTTTISFSELYSALQQGVVDGQENAYNTLATERYFETQKYVCESNHMMGVVAIVASNKWWVTLPADLQEAIREATRLAGTYQRKIFREQTAGSKRICIENGMQVTTPDLTEFREAVKVVYDDFYAKYPQYKGLVEQIQALEK